MHLEADREPGSWCIPWAPAAAVALGLLCVVPVRGPAKEMSLAGPSGICFGCVHCGALACVDPVTHASGFPFCPLFNRVLRRCIAAILFGRRHLPSQVEGRYTRVPCVCACACFFWPVVAAGLLGLLWCVSPLPVAVLGAPFVCVPTPGWGPCLCLFLFFFVFFLVSLIFASGVSGMLCSPAQGALGVGGSLFPPHPARRFFRPLSHLFFLVLGPCCPGLWRRWFAPPPRRLSFFVRCGTVLCSTCCAVLCWFECSALWGPCVLPPPPPPTAVRLCFGFGAFSSFVLCSALVCVAVCALPWLGMACVAMFGAPWLCLFCMVWCCFSCFALSGGAVPVASLFLVLLGARLLPLVPCLCPVSYCLAVWSLRPVVALGYCSCSVLGAAVLRRVFVLCHRALRW